MVLTHAVTFLVLVTAVAVTVTFMSDVDGVDAVRVTSDRSQRRRRIKDDGDRTGKIVLAFLFRLILLFFYLEFFQTG